MVTRYVLHLAFEAIDDEEADRLVEDVTQAISRYSLIGSHSAYDIKHCITYEESPGE